MKKTFRFNQNTLYHVDEVNKVMQSLCAIMRKPESEEEMRELGAKVILKSDCSDNSEWDIFNKSVVITVTIYD